uniref:Uncharacterized protein LOC104230094 n=1 Tax=Nicotiana sylvestris TaxID=4096 RepID=A0A1U7WME9_NICSY|nr:PREDICTED: uncharacterized protein LOC104230094 [Nicotiana sylvestris]
MVRTHTISTADQEPKPQVVATTIAELETTAAPKQRKGEDVDLESCRKSLRERVVDAFARWMYDAGLTFNCVNYTDSFSEFIEAVGQYGPGMKPPIYHETILNVGPENVVQVVTDNASENKKAGGMLKGVFPNIYWTLCAAHCINLMFGDIFKLAPYSTVFAKAIKIYSYISPRPLLLNIMRRYKKQRNLVKPAKTRFTTAILTLHNVYLQKQNLRTLVLSTEWSESIYAKETLGKEVARFIIGPYFWNDTVQALKVGNPLVSVLRLVDGEKKPPMGYIYEAMDRAKEAIEKAFDHDRRKYERVFEIIDKRWDDQLHQPLHAAWHILNLGLFYTNNENKTLDLNFWKEYHARVAKLVPDEVKQYKIGQELGVYMQADGILGLASAIRGRTKLALVEWWMQFGYEVPNLQQFAIRNIGSRYKSRNIIDPILLDNIDEENEWLTGGPKNHEEEEVFEGEGLTFGHVAMASGVE